MWRCHENHVFSHSTQQFALIETSRRQLLINLSTADKVCTMSLKKCSILLLKLRSDTNTYTLRQVTPRFM